MHRRSPSLHVSCRGRVDVFRHSRNLGARPGWRTYQEAHPRSTGEVPFAGVARREWGRGEQQARLKTWPTFTGERVLGSIGRPPAGRRTVETHLQALALNSLEKGAAPWISPVRRTFQRELPWLPLQERNRKARVTSTVKRQDSTAFGLLPLLRTRTESSTSLQTAARGEKKRRKEKEEIGEGGGGWWWRRRREKGEKGEKNVSTCNLFRPQSYLPPKARRPPPLPRPNPATDAPIRR